MLVDHAGSRRVSSIGRPAGAVVLIDRPAQRRALKSRFTQGIVMACRGRQPERAVHERRRLVSARGC